MRRIRSILVPALGLLAGCTSDPVADDRYAVQVTPPESTLIVGQSASLTAVVTNRLNEPREVPIHWSSSNSASVAVDSMGAVRALAVGTAYVVATAQGARDSALITVNPNRVSVTPASVVRAPGTSAAFQATVSNGPGSLTWDVADTTIAVVYSNGHTSARRVGTTTVRATLVEDPRHSASAEITVSFPVTVEFNATVEAITRTGTRDVVNRNQLSGTVDVHIVLKANAGSYTLQVLIDGAVAAQLPHSTGFDWRIVPLDTAALTNGSHSLSLRVLGAEGQPLVITAAETIGVSNP